MNSRTMKGLGIFAKGMLQQTIGYFMPYPTKFVVISSGRSGSNFLLSLLSSHPSIRIHGEVVGESRLRNMSMEIRHF
ncbi:hypothetical protein BROC_00895 [Candidatus Brocadiaceae bacterium]|nr:hypothetical protein BROC_00895 [Candidatus Brocadiaceae bacterium]